MYRSIRLNYNKIDLRLSSNARSYIMLLSSHQQISMGFPEISKVDLTDMVTLTILGSVIHFHKLIYSVFCC